MTKVLVTIFLLSLSFYNVNAQEKLSRKETRELKKKNAIKDLESGLLNMQIRFVADKMFLPSGNTVNARGGILFLKADRGEFMEFWWVDKNDKQTHVSTEFNIEQLNTVGSFDSGQIKLNFVSSVQNKHWKFELSIKPSGKSILLLKSSYGYYIKYNGRVSKL